jgi:hypothetical protein
MSRTSTPLTHEGTLARAQGDRIYARSSWVRVFLGAAWALSLVVAAIAAIRYGARLLSLPPRFAFLFIALFGLFASGAIVKRIYWTWARYFVPLDHTTNVVVKPVELAVITLKLAVVGVFATLIVFTGSLPLIGMTMLIACGASALLIRSYRETVSRPITNPIDVAPVIVDPDEAIEIAVAGIMRTGSVWEKGFNQRLMYEIPQSGRRLNPTAQNALLASDRRLYFIFVPVISADQWYARGQAMRFMRDVQTIQAQLEQMLRTMSLEQIYTSHAINFAVNRSDVSRIEVQRTGSVSVQRLVFFDQDGGRLTVAVRNRPDLERLATYFERAGIPLNAG